MEFNIFINWVQGMNPTEQIDKAKNRFSYGQNGLFTVGLEVWKEIYEHEKCGINEMVVFLSLSCGTDGEHIKSTWSINSVKKYIGLTEIPAKKALNNLVTSGFVKVIKPVLKAGDRPEYEVKNTTDEEGDYIWLPNSLIVGVKSESSPVNRLKKRNDKRLLYYFIRLYFFQDMRETGCISQQIIHAAPYEGIDKLETKLVTKINGKYNLIKLDYQWFTSSNTNFGTFGTMHTTGTGKRQKEFFTTEHCPKLNERGAWIILRPLWDMKLVEPVFFMSDAPDDSLDDERMFMYELFSDPQKKIADNILSWFKDNDERMVALKSIANKGSDTRKTAYGFVDNDYANASIKPMFRLKYRTKNPYSKNRSKDQYKFERELLQKIENEILD